MKYDSMRKLARNKALIKYAKKELKKGKKGETWKEIGKEFNITGSRAMRIYNKKEGPKNE